MFRRREPVLSRANHEGVGRGRDGVSPAGGGGGLLDTVQPVLDRPQDELPAVLVRVGHEGLDDEEGEADHPHADRDEVADIGDGVDLAVDDDSDREADHAETE